LSRSTFEAAPINVTLLRESDDVTLSVSLSFLGAVNAGGKSERLNIFISCFFNEAELVGG